MGYLLSFQPTFTQGLIVGQFSILLLLALVLKYLFLVSDPSSNHHLPTTGTKTTQRAVPLPGRVAGEAKEDESTEWLNVIISEVCACVCLVGIVAEGGIDNGDVPL